jgi:hypothetical protein
VILLLGHVVQGELTLCEPVTVQAGKSARWFRFTARGTCSATFPHTPTTTHPMSTAMLNVCMGDASVAAAIAGWCLSVLTRATRAAQAPGTNSKINNSHEFVKWENS